jgi:hypothetical protein
VSPLDATVVWVVARFRLHWVETRIIIVMCDGSFVNERFTPEAGGGIIQLSDAWIHAAPRRRN